MEAKLYYQNIFEQLHELNRKYSLVIMDDITIRNDGGYFFDAEDLRKQYWVLSGSMPEDMVYHAIQDYDFEEIDKEGNWMIHFLIEYHKAPSYDDNSEAYIVHTSAVFLCTLEEAERNKKDFEEMTSPDNDKKDLFGNDKATDIEW